MTTPYPFQLEDVNAINGRALLSWEMGLGKTFGALLYLKKHPEIKRTVVICPWGVKWQWEREAHQHIGLRSDILEGTWPEHDRLTEAAPLTIANYDILGERRVEKGTSGPGQLPYLLALNPDLVILDEAHLISGRTSLRTRCVQKLCKNVNRILALTGTPILNRPAEIWTIANLLWPKKFPSFPPFGREFCEPVVEYGTLRYRGAANLGRLNKRLTRCGMFRRRKQDVLTELPPLQKIVLPMPIRNRKRYAKARDNFLAWLAEEHPGHQHRVLKKQRMVQLGYLVRLAARLKMRAVEEWIDNFLEASNEKLALFAVHKRIIRRLRKRYPHCVVVDGSTNHNDRKLAVKKFQTDRRCRVFIGNVKAAGIGLDGLQRVCSHGALVEMPWSPGDVNQVMGRLDRLGQKQPISFWLLVATGTIEELLCRVLQKKSKILARVIDGGRGLDDLNVWDELEKEVRK